jgi:hypothetical protein
MVMVGQHKRLAEPMSGRQKRGLAIALVVLALAIAGGTVYAVTSNDSFGTSHNGCVSLTIASSLGAAVIHKCGSDAKALCAAAQTASDPVSRALRPQCVLAGYRPARSSG